LVSALVAPNAYHNKGQPAWRARFPRAVCYAPTGAHSRLSNKTPGVEYRPIEELAQKLWPARVLLPDGMKSPDIMLQIPTQAGLIRNYPPQSLCPRTAIQCLMTPWSARAALSTPSTSSSGFVLPATSAALTFRPDACRKNEKELGVFLGITVVCDARRRPQVVARFQALRANSQLAGDEIGLFTAGMVV
jgi:hypothetical protein